MNECKVCKLREKQLGIIKKFDKMAADFDYEIYSLPLSVDDRKKLRSDLRKIVWFVENFIASEYYLKPEKFNERSFKSDIE
jgi:hypothetical protein